jgi:ketosteroid isomerase-like protein
MRTWPALLSLALVTAGCRDTAPPTPSPAGPADEASDVEATLRRWYDAAEKHDSAGYADLMLPTFFIFEDTTVFDKPTLSRLVSESFTLGTDRSRLYDFKTQVSGDVAWSSFRNDEVWTPNGGTPELPRRFLESVIFRRVGGRWLLERYHATRINRLPGE